MTAPQSRSEAPRPPRHVVHLLYRFAAGGLENVVVQLINGLPQGEFRHTVVALTTIDAEFAKRIERHDVEFIAMNKPPGQPFKLYPAMYRLFKRLRPDVLHSCNIAALEFTPVAALAGVPLRVHAEHGWDVADPDGSNQRYQLLRRIYQRFVHRFVAVSVQLRDYLVERVGVAEARVALIPNGVDTERFRPALPHEPLPDGFPFDPSRHWIVGFVGRFEPIKNPGLLAKAFVAMIAQAPERMASCRLVMVGHGPLQPEVRHILAEAGLVERFWAPGVRSDIPGILRTLRCFVLPSLSEGTSCILQEAMATAVPIVATDVGGNRQLLRDGALGKLVPSEDATAMVLALAECFDGRNGHLRNQFEARICVERDYSLVAVINRYARLFGRDQAVSQRASRHV